MPQEAPTLTHLRVVRDKVSETVAWGLLAVTASIGLIGVAYYFGKRMGVEDRVLEKVAEPGD